MDRKFSPAQQRYIAARAAYEVAQKEFNRRMAPYHPNKRDLTDEEIETIVDREMQIEKEIGLDIARDEFFRAKLALIDWLQSTVEKEPRYRKNKTLLDQLFKKGIIYPHIREKLIDTAMKLAL